MYIHYSPGVCAKQLEPGLHNRIASLRRRNGLSLSGLAERAGISRQSLSAIEQGRHAPSVAVALKLADCLDTEVSALFWQGQGILSERPLAAGTRVRISRTPQGWWAEPLRNTPIQPADGVVEEGGRVRFLVPEEQLAGAVTVGGCDPALGLLRSERLRWEELGNGRAAARLRRGALTAATVHGPSATEQEHPDLVGLPIWTQPICLVAAPANPLGVSGPPDLARPELRLVAREAGSGARRILDQLLARSGRPLPAATRIAWSPSEVAAAIASGGADLGIAPLALAKARDLTCFPLEEEIHALVYPKERAGSPQILKLLERLGSALFRRQLASLEGYRQLGP